MLEHARALINTEIVSASERRTRNPASDSRVQTCAVARCAGTLVNLRKPLCNLGSVFAADIHGARVVLQSCWHMITDSVGAIVEVRSELFVGAQPLRRSG